MFEGAVRLLITDIVIFLRSVAEEGNITSGGEFNWECDPEAAHAVLAGLNKVITLLPDEICREASTSWVCL